LNFKTEYHGWIYKESFAVGHYSCLTCAWYLVIVQPPGPGKWFAQGAERFDFLSLGDLAAEEGIRTQSG
jgi:hypothetical protein